MFCSKSKATWKEAHKLKTSSKFIQIRLLQSLVKDLKNLVIKFKSEEHTKLAAYIIAQKNNFEGNPKFHWWVAELYLGGKIAIYEDEIKSTEELISESKRRIRCRSIL